MHIWYHPATLQVMAFSSHGSGSTVWEARGYQFIVNENPEIETHLNRLGRDCKLTIKEGVITGCSASENPIQPVEPDPDGEDLAA